MKPYRLRRLETTASTNDDARQAAVDGEVEGLVIHALKQTAGRGRHGRQWESPEGNLYCSILLRPKTEPRFFGQYSFVVSLALADTIKKFAPQSEITLKWPNDVLAGGKKISGILLETGEGYLVIGIGANVMHHPENSLYTATSLKECMGKKSGGNPPPSKGGDHHHAGFDMALILETLLERFWHWYGIMQQEGFAPIREVWLQNAQKGQITVKLPNEILEGGFIDIDQEGYLRLRLETGVERVITSGDVFFA